MLSKADDCADLVFSFMLLNMKSYFQTSFWSVCENARLADKTDVGNALSKMDSDGASLEMIGRLLGHTQLGTTQRYAHLINSGRGERGGGNAEAAAEGRGG
jgi:hypothetical protein